MEVHDNFDVVRVDGEGVALDNVGMIQSQTPRLDFSHVVCVAGDDFYCAGLAVHPALHNLSKPSTTDPFTVYYVEGFLPFPPGIYI